MHNCRVLLLLQWYHAIRPCLVRLILFATPPPPPPPPPQNPLPHPTFLCPLLLRGNLPSFVFVLATRVHLPISVYHPQSVSVSYCSAVQRKARSFIFVLMRVFRLYLISSRLVYARISSIVIWPSPLSIQTVCVVQRAVFRYGLYPFGCF